MIDIRAGKRLRPVVVREGAVRSRDGGNSMMEQLMGRLRARRELMGVEQISSRDTEQEQEEEEEEEEDW